MPDRRDRLGLSILWKSADAQRAVGKGLYDMVAAGVHRLALDGHRGTVGQAVALVDVPNSVVESIGNYGLLEIFDRTRVVTAPGKHEDISIKTYGSMEGVKKGLATLSGSATIRRRPEIFNGKPLAMGYISHRHRLWHEHDL